MLGLNVISGFRRESLPSLRESLASAWGRCAAAAPLRVLQGRGLFLAASLGAGLIGGLAPAALSARLHPPVDTAAVSHAVDKIQKLEAEQIADAAVVRTIAQANSAMQARLDMLEKRLAKVERGNFDANSTGAIAPVVRPSPPPKPDSKRKPPKA